MAIELYQERQIVPAGDAYDEHVDLRGYGRVQESAIRTLGELGQIESAASVWLAQQLERGATIVGNAIVDAAGELIGKITKSGTKTLLSTEMPKIKQPRRNATVSQTVPRKGGSQQRQAVFKRAPTVAAPVAVSRRINVKSKPSMKSGKRGLIITHREMIGQIITPATGTDFNAIGFICNPGRYSTFPWLSSLAGNFDKYILRKLQFTTLSNQATSTSGRVGIAFDMDSTDPLPGDRNEFFAMTYHAECSPWDSVTLSIPVDGKERFVNSHTLSDSKLIDVGQVVFMSDAVATSAGALNATAISDVIVEYSVELLDPQQAIYSTQVITGKNAGVATLDLLTSSGPLVVSPSNVTPYVSTSTILYAKALQGYYMGSLYTGDANAGSPTLALALHGGTGTENRSGVIGTATNNIVFKCRITSNDGVIRVTIGAVALSNLERLIFMFSRVSATVYNAATVADYDTSTTTF